MQPAQAVRSLLTPACVDISAVFKSLYRTASSGRVKINYQITAKRNSGTVTESEKSGKRNCWRRKRTSYFAPKYFPLHARAYKTENWQEPPPRCSSQLDA